jgi:hypothetical protein
MSGVRPEFTYAGDPANSPRDAVRFLVGDTNPLRPLLDDREVDYAIAQNPNQNLAAALLAEHLFGRFASQSDISVGPVSKAFSKAAELMKAKSEQLRADACRNARPSFPAIFVADKKALECDESLTRPQFFIGLGDNRFAVQLNHELNKTGFDGSC